MDFIKQEAKEEMLEIRTILRYWDVIKGTIKEEFAFDTVIESMMRYPIEFSDLYQNVSRETSMYFDQQLIEKCMNTVFEQDEVEVPESDMLYEFITNTVVKMCMKTNYCETTEIIHSVRELFRYVTSVDYLD